MEMKLERHAHLGELRYREIHADAPFTTVQEKEVQAEHNRPSTSLSNSTAPETDDSSSEQSETSDPFDDRDDVLLGRNLLVPVDPNRAARIFGPV
jgi:hypothetical protein